MPATPFASVPLAPRDPILGLNEQFGADPRADKVNLGVGVYYDSEGRLPLLASVRSVESERARAAPARGYLPIDGMAQYNRAVQSLLFGSDSALLAEGRVATVQTLGGTGALKVGADLLKRFLPQAGAWISDPSWENHRALFESAGFEVSNYPYYDAASNGFDFDGMTESLAALPADSVVVLHACCHNPTGIDPTPEQWDRIVATCVERGLMPFLDIAYQGFAEGIEQDASVVRKFAAAGVDFLVASSFSKSFSLYGERVGALSVVCASRDETQRVLSQLKRVIRTNYSNPPTHGGTLVATVLDTPALRAEWEAELGGMRDRIRAMRSALVARLRDRGVSRDYGFLERQRGMFSYTGLSPAQVERLRDEFGVYAVSTGRICMAAINARNIDRVADAIAAVSR